MFFCLVLATCSLISTSCRPDQLHVWFPGVEHSFNHEHPQCTLFWFYRYSRKTPSGITVHLCLSLSHTQEHKQFPLSDCLISDPWFSSVCCTGPLHLEGMFHTPVNCLHTSVFHLCAPSESLWAPLWCYILTMPLWAEWTVLHILTFSQRCHIDTMLMILSLYWE